MSSETEILTKTIEGLKKANEDLIAKCVKSQTGIVAFKKIIEE